MRYDSTEDTNKHRENVYSSVKYLTKCLMGQTIMHDLSKLETPEKELFDIYTPKLKESTYGSEEYKQNLIGLKPALDHHYSKNRHHPEHFKKGINDMNLVDLIEMLCDWYAATKRHNDGDINRSIKINRKRFKYTKQLEKILLNTVELLKEIKP
jgi:hypothetical protein